MPFINFPPRKGSDAEKSVNSDPENQAGDSQQPEDVDEGGGYPRLCSYMESDSDLFQFRRFGELGIRNLLYMQDELAVLEKRLNERDEILDTENGCCREDKDEERILLMRRIRILIQEYTQALEAQVRLRALARPTPSQRRSLRDWIGDKRPLVGEEDEFIEPVHQEDLICLAAEKGLLHGVVDRSGWLRKVFRKKEVNLKFKEPDVVYYSELGVKRVERALVIFCGVVFLVVPLFPLSTWSETTSAIYIVLIMVATFAGFVGVLTRLGNGEVLGACAAYAAVLVVFLGTPNITNIGVIDGKH